MAAPPRNWPFVGALARWYRNWSAARESAFELQCAGAAEVERIAQELGLSSFQLQQLVNRTDERELLAQRMAVLHLEPAAFAQSELATFRDLQRVCALCGVRDRCADDLAEQGRDPAWQDWRDYCPNATTLSALATLQVCSEAREAD
jgi:transposase-like protein